MIVQRPQATYEMLTSINHPMWFISEGNFFDSMFDGSDGLQNLRNHPEFTYLEQLWGDIGVNGILFFHEEDK